MATMIHPHVCFDCDDDFSSPEGSTVPRVAIDGPVTVLDNGDVECLGSSAHKPIDADGRSAMDCTDYPLESKYVLSPDLQTLVCAQYTNCVAQQPCD